MKYLKQYIYVVSILFFSLMSSLALSYVITPTLRSVTLQDKTHQLINTELSNGFNKSLIILLPKMDK